MKIGLLLLSLLLLLNGCAQFGAPKAVGPLRATEPSDLQVLNSDIPVPDVSFSQVLQEYRDILPLVEDAVLAEQIERRIAGVLMMRAQYQQEIAAPVPELGYYADVIAAYRSILDKYPQAADQGESLYQLARAYDLDVRNEEALDTLGQLLETYPASPWYDEALFRMGNIQFSRQRYRRAESRFQQLVNRESERWMTNAYYMAGWSQFKQLLYPEAVNSFAGVLARHVPESGDLSDLAVIEKRLVTDTLSIMALTLSNANGVQDLQRQYAQPAPDYVWLVYEALGQLYLEKERYADAASTYRSYIELNTTADRAPYMHLAMIDAYKTGGFSRYVLDEKEAFVSLYGLDSAYWNMRNAEQRQSVRAPLKTYLDELSRYYHAGARSIESDIKEASAADLESLQDEQLQAYSKAGNYYEAYAKTFPADTASARMIYMAGETYFESGRFESAIRAYENAAYEWPAVPESDGETQTDAGYAAILAYSRLLETLKSDAVPEQQLDQWRAASVSSMLKFAQVFPQDSRGSAVLSQASEQLFALSQYQRAYTVAQNIISSAAVDAELLNTAYSIAGLSQYELAGYVEAESAFAEQLALMDPGDDDYRVVEDRLAASIYQQAEQAIAAGQMETGIDDLLRIKSLAPNSAIRRKAQYDAAGYLVEAERYKAAITELEQMQRLYPDYEHAVQYNRKLAFAYEKLGELDRAADLYLALYQQDPDADVRREALYVAAEMYDQLGQRDTAIEWYLKYVFEYEQPFDLRMEARNRLAVLYRDAGNYDRHLYWLRRTIDGDAEAGSQRTERSRYLAAWAQSAYGDYFRIEFERVRLTLPLDQPLQRKIKALEDAQLRYEKSAEYGIGEFAAKATYNIADLYYQFFKALMNSERPEGLTALEQDEYMFMLEDQAIPFEDQAIALHEKNISRSWSDQYNEWVQESFDALAQIFPVRYDKEEQLPETQGLK